MPWSFNSLMHLVERGQVERYDDVIEDERNPSHWDRKDMVEPARGRSVAESELEVNHQEEEKRPHNDRIKIPSPEGRDKQYWEAAPH